MMVQNSLNTLGMKCYVNTEINVGQQGNILIKIFGRNLNIQAVSWTKFVGFHSKVDKRQIISGAVALDQNTGSYCVIFWSKYVCSNPAFYLILFARPCALKLLHWTFRKLKLCNKMYKGSFPRHITLNFYHYFSFRSNNI